MYFIIESRCFNVHVNVYMSENLITASRADSSQIYKQNESEVCLLGGLTARIMWLPCSGWQVRRGLVGRVLVSVPVSRVVNPARPSHSYGNSQGNSQGIARVSVYCPQWQLQQGLPTAAIPGRSQSAWLQTHPSRSVQPGRACQSLAIRALLITGL